MELYDPCSKFDFKKMDDLEKNQEKIQRELKELVDKLKDNLN